MRVFIQIVLLSLYLFTVHTPLRAEVLLVGISVGYPPYYYEKDGSFTGFCVETINAVAREMGIEVQYMAFPWKRLIKKAQKGEVDAIMPLFKTETRKEFLIFKGLELAPETNHLFTSEGSQILITGNLDDLKSYRIGVVEGYSYGKRFDSFDFPKKEITRNDKHLIEMFLHNRFDIGVGNRYVVQYYAELAGASQTVKFHSPPITKEILYLGVAKKRNENNRAARLADTLQIFKTTEEYRDLVNKYGIVE